MVASTGPRVLVDWSIIPEAGSGQRHLMGPEPGPRRGLGGIVGAEGLLDRMVGNSPGWARSVVSDFGTLIDI